MIHDAAGDRAVDDPRRGGDRAGIVRWMIHNAAGYGRGSIHDA
jgi:hypothetical protein